MVRLTLPLSNIPYSPPPYTVGGYTIWFHYTCFLALLSGSKFLHRLTIAQGITVCLGWYLSQLYELVKYGEAFAVLYDNSGSVNHRGLIHLADLAAHPGLTYLCWYLWRHRTSPYECSKCHDEWNAFPSTLSSLLLSRFWSVLHNLHNEEDATLPGILWYQGSHVYSLRRLDGWKYAYLAEAAAYFYLFWEMAMRQRGGPKGRDDEQMGFARVIA